jgi:glycosyltransferase involved in cell wall biosynthesis
VRITFLLPCDNLTGGARVVALYASELQKLGHEVLVVTCAADRPSLRDRAATLLGRRPARQAPLAGHIAASGLPHQILQRPGAVTADDVPDADFIVATWWETANWIHAMPPRKGVHVHLIQGYEVWIPGQKEQVHAALQLPNIKIAISTDLRATIVREVGPLPVSVIANALDPRQFDAPPRGRNDQPTVGFIYSTQRIKGADVCIRAIELARQRLPSLEVVAFGADEPVDALPLPAGTRWFHRPAQNALREHYAACDAWLFGSRLDSFGLPVLEAMACRTPVVGVPVGAAPQLLAGGTGLLVPGENPQAMADALVELLSGPAPAWEAMSTAACERAHARTWTDAARELLAVLTPPGS